MLREFTDDVSIDALGSVHAHLGSGENKILLDAHIDRIGMIVTSIAERGFLHFAACGGLDARVLVGKPVVIFGKKKIYGIISSIPPHLADKDNNDLPKIEDMLIDTGLSEEECRENISVGDIALPDAPILQLLGMKIAAPALDDRCCVAAILRCLELLKEEKLPCTLCVQFAVQEETGGSGAAAGAYIEDVNEAIAVDVSFAKASGTPVEVSAELGKGALIAYGPTLDRRISRKLKNIAQEKGISVQTEVCAGRSGTDADEIQLARGGVPCGVVSVPQKNMHTSVEVIDLEDVESVAQLLAEYVKAGGVCGG